jgi:hypothetical protein
MDRSNLRSTQRLRAWPVLLLRSIAGAARVAVYLGALAGLLVILFARSVDARIGESGMALGRELAEFHDLLGGIHRVVLNGESLYVASAVTEGTMGQVLDRFERMCRAHTGGLAAQFDALPKAVQQRVAERVPAAWEQRLGIVREERSNEAALICIERGEGRGLVDTVNRLTAFAEDGELSELGNLRYVYVRPADGAKVHVLTTLTQGSFNLYKVMGIGRSEPAGSDPRETPRAPGSTRIMSAELEGAMYGAYLFASPELPSDLLRFYDGELPGRGWSKVVEQRELGVEVWQRDGVTMVVSASRSDNEETSVSFAQGRTTAPEDRR